MNEKTIFKKVVNSNGIYSCDELDISVEEWKKVLQDKSITNNYKLWLSRFYLEPEHKASCKHMGDKYNCNPNSPNSTIMNFGKTTQKLLNRFEVLGTDGKSTYWVIPMKKGIEINNLFEWTMRDELVQALEELDITTPDKFEEDTSFTWIPFYQEMAEKLLEYKNNRSELIKIVYGMDEEDVSFFKDGKKKNFKDLHPFALYGIFNRKILPYKKIRICTYLKDKLQIKSNIPLDFDGVPTVANLNSWWGMPWSKNDASKDIKSNWKLFEIIQENQINEDDLKNKFNFILSRGGAKKYLTMALYWIRPYEFMPLDSNSREYLQKIGINVFDEKDLNGQNYLDLCKIIKEKIANNEIKEKSIPEISYNAWLRDPQGDTQMEVQYWLIAPGENARKWDEYSKNGEIGIGWEELGNIEKYDSDYESFQNDYIKTYKSENDNYRGSSPKQIWDFYKNISIGDIIFARNGVRQIIGMGKVTSDYKYDDSRDEYKHLRKVEWEKIGEWDYPGQSSRDTVHKLRQEQAEEILKTISYQMTDYEKKLDEIKKNLLANKNIILTGAPGTGKTFMAKQIAKELGCEDDNIGFVQFHPSYDYTDFVEGLRPTDKDGNGNVGFERKDGVFKEFCERALENLVETPLNNDESHNFDEAWENLLNEVRENIAAGKLTKIGIWEYGLSSTNSLKYESTDTQSKYTFTVTKKNVFDAYRGIKARPSGYFQKYMKEVADYMKKYGLKEYKEQLNPEKEKIPLKNFVFIIDEINRGEVAKIFGELFYCVDPGYRGEKGYIKTQYANLENEGNIFDRVLQKKEKDFGHFFIPENVYIIGTMNDIDRSVESMDFAFRRRFSWIEVKASDTVDMLDSELSAELTKDAKKRMIRLNKAIWDEKENKGIEGLNEAYHIGASYFLKLNNYDGDFEKLWKYHIKGILQEYLRGNPNTPEELKKLKKAYYDKTDTPNGE